MAQTFNRRPKKLTDRKLKALAKRPAAAGTTYDVSDGEVPGLVARVMPSGRRSFALIARYPGFNNPTRRALGSYGELTLEAARTKARAWRDMIARGIDPAVAEERERASNIQRQQNTFGVVAEAWFQDKLANERKGREVERDVRKAFVAPWSDKPISDITDLDVLTVIKAKARTAPAQARNLLGIAKRLFAWVVDQRCYGLKTSPVADLKPAKIIGKKKRRSRVLTDDELFALWRAATRMPYPAGPVYRLLVLSALRLNEPTDAAWSEFNPAVVRALRQRKGGTAVDWTRVKPNDLTWTIPTSRMKGQNDEEERPHLVPLTPDMLKLLETVPQFHKGSHLFSTTFGEKPVWIGDKIKKQLDGRMLRTLRALARKRGDDPAKVRLAHWVNHDIRRTVRSNLSRLRITEEAREAVLAHARPGIKGTYDLHDYFDEKREALLLWAARLRDIVEPPPVNVVALKAKA
jgi:Arm DNA-binding domain